VTARIVADAMVKHLPQPIVIENRSGASGTVGTLLAKQEAADGYTLLFGIQASLALNPSLFKAAKYDAKTDFVGISLLTESPYVITVPGDSSIMDYEDFKAAANERLTIANGGSAALLASRLLARQANLSFTNIPYSGSGAAISDILAGRVNAMISSPVSVLPHIASGALRPILVTSGERYPALPDTPTAQELGFDGFDVSGWYSIVAPAGLPKDRQKLLSEAFNAALSDEDTRTRLVQAGVTPSARALDGAGTSAFIETEIDRWSTEISEAGIEAK
jgi:tripartite-type tricarboxylate transporter receptor subunit TctC